MHTGHVLSLQIIADEILCLKWKYQVLYLVAGETVISARDSSPWKVVRGGPFFVVFQTKA